MGYIHCFLIITLFYTLITKKQRKKFVFLVCQQLTPNLKFYDDCGVTEQAYCEICHYVYILR